MKTNGELQKDVYEELKWDPRVHEGDIGVSVGEGIVTLGGYIPTFAEKWAAEEAAQRVSGVHAVVNEIEVKLTGTAVKDDHDLAKAALQAITWNAWTAGNSVRIAVQNAWITLSGEVETEFQRRMAENAVRQLTGVRGISNDIEVRPAVNSKDIQYQIKRALHRHADQEANAIAVDVNGGEVSLSGRVGSWRERADVEWAASATAGVSKVKNDLRISNS